MNESLRPFIFIVAVAGAVLVVFTVALGWYGSWLDDREAREWAISDGYCNIAVVPIQGDIVAFEGDRFYEEGIADAPIATAGDWAERYITSAEFDSAIVGIVAQIDSYGGYAAPGHQIMRALKSSPLPSVAYIREAGISAGYLVALGADTIVAAPFAAVGSIGITYSYVQNVGRNQKDGLEFVQLSSGAFKDIGNPNKPLTDEERILYERDIAAFNGIFIDLVATSRGMSKAAVAELADGSSMPAALALEKGLIDAVGDEESVSEWFAKELGMSRDEIVFCK